MSEPEKKKTATKIYHYIFWALILVPVAVAAILPATGPYVLLDEGCVALVFLAAALYLAIFLCQSFDKRKKKRALIIGIVCVLIFSLLGFWFGRNVVLDGVQGTQIVTVTDIEVGKRLGNKGRRADYFLSGTANGQNQIQVKISRKDYDRLGKIDRIAMEYYPHTRRVVRFL
ncbi:Yip1 family protein [Catenibacillus scindens]|uniref:Yip1 family protein n=1 Tax=Catenibacillus scindens TaxID=673271 RepID=UPI003207D66C